MENVSTLSGEDITDKEEGDQGWLTSAPKRKSKKQRRPMVATRTSSRIAKMEGPILEKATKRMPEKDALLGGNKTNPFTVLNSVFSSHMKKLIQGLGIEVEQVDNQIETFRAKEKARAALAEANYKAYLECTNNRNAPQDEEDLAELTMEVIDNASRGAGTEMASETNPSLGTRTERGKNSKKKKNQ